MGSAEYEKIKETSVLPSPTGVALEILRLTGDEDATIDAITAAVESDPATSARMVKLVNSPLAGVSRRIASVSSAVKLLGLQTVKSLALGFSLVAGGRKGPCKAFDYEAFWSESLARAVSARSIANQLRDFVPDEVFTVGLLSRIGQLALATAYPEAYAYALSCADPDESGPLLDTEREMFEIDHNELSAEMMADWHLPDLLCDAVRRQDSAGRENCDPDFRADQLARTLHLGGAMAFLLTRSKVYRDSLAVLINEANRLGIRPDAFQHVFDMTSAQWQDVGAIFSVATRRVPALAEIYARAHARRSALDHAHAAGPTTNEAPVEARR